VHSIAKEMNFKSYSNLYKVWLSQSLRRVLGCAVNSLYKYEVTGSFGQKFLGPFLHSPKGDIRWSAESSKMGSRTAIRCNLFDGPLWVLRAT